MQIINLSYEYQKKQVFTSFNLTIPENSIVALVGSNGSGKSTLLNCLTGKYTKYKGEIKKKSNNISFVADISKQYEFLTGVEYLSLINYILGNSCDFIPLLKEFNLYKSKDMLIKNYSHGMKQKLSLCSALIVNPIDYLIMDEPFTGVDSDSMGKIKEKLANLKNEGLTIIFTTHQIENYLDICDHVFYIDDIKVKSHDN